LLRHMLVNDIAIPSKYEPEVRAVEEQLRAEARGAYLVTFRKLGLPVEFNGISQFLIPNPNP
ncbi:MAG: hypothetical protein ACTSUE_05975, partial [Promethearchaeota archaeon]